MISPLVSRITFTPCTGFGDQGRAATLLDASGECIALGYGATDDEAILEALIDAGLSFDAAFDSYAMVRDSARLDRPGAHA